MNTYIITRINGRPDWEKIPALAVDQILWLPDAGISMTQQICYDDTRLYLRQKAVEAHIRAAHTDALAAVCEDSCMEFFFCPEEQDARYFNFEWNLNGCLFLGFRTDRQNAVRLQAANHKELFHFRSAKTRDGWEIFYEIPASFIKLFFPEFSLKSGKILRANCYKCGDKTKSPHYLSWNPVSSQTPDFHRSQDFGCMVLE